MENGRLGRGTALYVAKLSVTVQRKGGLNVSTIGFRHSDGIHNISCGRPLYLCDPEVFNPRRSKVPLESSTVDVLE